MSGIAIHLIEQCLPAPRISALEPSQLQSFAYDGKARLLEIQFRVTTPYAYDELPLPPPPKVIQYSEVPRYVFRKLLASKTARQQERYWESHIKTRFRRAALLESLPAGTLAVKIKNLRYSQARRRTKLFQPATRLDPVPEAAFARGRREST